MIRFIFGLIPWWMFALATISFVPLSFEFYEDMRAQETEADFAVLEGPPDLTPLRDYNPSRSVGYFREVYLDGQLRADLGIQNIWFGETQYTYVLLDDNGAGPLVAILETATRSETMITNLVNNADSAGQVAVNGFLAPSRVGDISRQLARGGLSSRELIVIEPFFDDRAGAIAARVEDARFTFYVVIGLTAFFALMALWRFSRWRKRRRARAGARAAKPAPKPSTAPAQAAVASPWDSFQPVDSNIAPAPAKAAARKPGIVAPQSLEEQRRAQKRSSQVANRARPANRSANDAADDIPATVPEFESVFPGGGSGFRFKTADEIIRQSFGTLSTLTKVNRTDD